MPFFEDSKHCAEILNYTLETQRRIQNDVSSVCLYVTVIYHQNEIWVLCKKHKKDTAM